MKNVVVTNASSTTALAMIRSLGRRKIPVVACDSVSCSIGFMSRYCTKRALYENPLIHPKRCLQTLTRIGKKLKRPVLLPAGDDIIHLAMKYRSEIEENFILPLPSQDSLKHAVDRQRTMHLASKLGIPIPKTFTLSTLDQLRDLKDEITYPAVLKPRVSAGFRIKFGKKIFKIWSFKQLVDAYRQVSESFPNPLIQEYIPGGTRNLYSLSTIFDPKHRPLGVFSIRKLHQLMEGVTACGEYINNAVITDLSIRILKALHWIGPAEVEFKKDSRDGKFKLMEINPRPFMWINLPIKAGFDIPYLWYKIAIGEACEEITKLRKDLKFINLVHSFLGSIEMLFRNADERRISDFLAAFSKGRYAFDLLLRDDILPFVCYPLLFPILRLKEARS